MKQFLLSWTAPTSGGIVNDYLIEYSLDAQDWQAYSDDVSLSTSGIVSSGLDLCLSYLFRVAAINNIGTGEYSNTVTGQIRASAPSTPTNLVAITGNQHFKLSWVAPDSTECDITDYVIEYYKNNEASTYKRTNGTNTNYILFNLTNNEPYSIRVAAISTVGTGLYSALLTNLIPVEKPNPVTTFYVYAETDERIGLSWLTPDSIFDSYRIQYSTNTQWEDLATIDKSITYYSFDHPIADTDYSFRIATINVALLSDYNTENLYFTPPRDPLYNKTKLLLRMGDLL